MKNVFLLFVFASASAFGQSVVHNWSAAYGGNNNQFLQTVASNGSGDLITVGFFDIEFFYEDEVDINVITSNGEYDLFVQKTDATGQVIWVKQIGGTGNEYGFDNCVDAAGNIYITGNFQNTVDFDPNGGVFELTADGSNPAIFVLKLDTDGNFVWAKTFSGAGFDYGRAIAVDESGNVIIAGEFQNTVDFDPGAGVTNLTAAGLDDIFLVKLNADGALIWANKYGGTGRDYAFDLALDSNNDIAVTGSFRATVDFDFGAGIAELTAEDDYDAYVLKTKTDGTFDWVKQFGGTEGEEGIAIAIDDSNAIYFVGSFSGLTDFDPGADLIEFDAGASFAGYLVKLAANGDLAWVNTFSSSGYISVSDVLITEDEDVCIGGFFTNFAGVDTPTGVPTFNSAGAEDVFLAVYDYNNNFKWSGQVSGAENVTIRGLAKGTGDKIYTGIMFAGSLDADPNLTSETISGIGREVGIIQLDGATLSLGQDQFGTLNVYPNPSNGLFQMNLTKVNAENSTLFVHNLQGELVCTKQINKTTTTLNLTELPKGLYVLKYNGFIKKVILQ